MSLGTMPTIFQLVDEVCARDFPVLAKLGQKTYNQLVYVIYDDIMCGDKPEEITEDLIFNYVEEFIARVLADNIED
jgi:hypothetical protein